MLMIALLMNVQAYKECKVFEEFVQLRHTIRSSTTKPETSSFHEINNSIHGNKRVETKLVSDRQT